MPQFCTCTCWPGAIGTVANPMIWPYRITGSPTAMGLIATLWPEGMRSTVVTPSATTVPGGRLARAISTPSSECRRMTGLMVMASLLASSSIVPRTQRKCAAEPGPSCHVIYSLATGSRLCGAALRAAPRPGHRERSRLAGGILPGLVDLQLGVGRHQADLVRQRHQLETHVDRARGTFGATAMDAGVET